MADSPPTPRQIKFRAWHEGRKQWLHDGKPPLGGCHILGETIWAFGEWCRVPLEELNDVVVEQFTGLVDKNGIEIYEGDIVFGIQPVGTYQNRYPRNHAGEVTWDADYAGWYIYGEYPEPPYQLYRLTERLIWGNRHEPESKTS